MYDQVCTLEAAKLGHPKAMGKMSSRYYDCTYLAEKGVAKAFDFATKAAKEEDEVGVVGSW